jgi:tRNA A-37 threonylcarbamoyl transferase component Bud32
LDTFYWDDHVIYELDLNNMKIKQVKLIITSIAVGIIKSRKEKRWAQPELEQGPTQEHRTIKPSRICKLHGNFKGFQCSFTCAFPAASAIMHESVATI